MAVIQILLKYLHNSNAGIRALHTTWNKIKIKCKEKYEYYKEPNLQAFKTIIDFLQKNNTFW